MRALLNPETRHRLRNRHLVRGMFGYIRPYLLYMGICLVLVLLMVACTSLLPLVVMRAELETVSSDRLSDIDRAVEQRVSAAVVAARRAPSPSLSIAIR